MTASALPPYSIPAFCHECGEPYPWTQSKLEAAKEQIEMEQSLSVEDKVALTTDIEDIAHDSPRAGNAAKRVKAILQKVGGTAGPMLQGFCECRERRGEEMARAMTRVGAPSTAPIWCRDARLDHAKGADLIRFALRFQPSTSVGAALLGFFNTLVAHDDRLRRSYRLRRGAGPLFLAAIALRHIVPPRGLSDLHGRCRTGQAARGGPHHLNCGSQKLTIAHATARPITA
jgi:uncharacterized protein DUF2321